MMTPEIIRHLSQDNTLKTVIDHTVPYDWGTGESVYTDLLGSIISQQLSVKAAATIQNRFLALFDNGQPQPEQLLRLELTTLRAVGLSQQKSSYMRHVATFFLEENILDKDWSTLEDDEIIRYLTQIKGVGKWTVEMILMFTLNRPDVLPVDDLGIQNSMKKLYGIADTGKILRQRMVEVAECWRPYRTYACRYLWKWKDQ